jgi:2-polyprenyl-6-methoxyphenol hydroxylase-like FAD-dependent oxidoreductase
MHRILIEVRHLIKAAARAGTGRHNRAHGAAPITGRAMRSLTRRDPFRGGSCLPKEALSAFQGWASPVTKMVAAVRHDLQMGLFPAAPLRRWRRGRVALLGDAAHAMLPYRRHCHVSKSKLSGRPRLVR